MIKEKMENLEYKIGSKKQDLKSTMEVLKESQEDLKKLNKMFENRKFNSLWITDTVSVSITELINITIRDIKETEENIKILKDYIKSLNKEYKTVCKVYQNLVDIGCDK